MRSEDRNSTLGKETNEIDYRIHHAFETYPAAKNQSTHEFVSEKVKNFISRLLPGATYITIYDYAGDLSDFYGVNIEALRGNRNLLYIYYSNSPVYRCGGREDLLIIDKDSLEVIYRGYRNTE